MPTRSCIDQPGWVLLPLRAFLATVFLYGGISKIADRRFLDPSSPVSMHATVLAVRGGSPVGSLLGPVATHTQVVGVLLALAELAVGLGMLLGLLVRVAAAGGMLLALALWLTVSWNSAPWFTSADLVYMFAFVPLLIAGAGGVLSLDGWLGRSAVRHPTHGEDRTRRTLVTGAAALFGAALAGGASLFRRSPPARTHGARAGGTAGAGSAEVLAKASAVPVGGAAKVIDPVRGEPIWVLQLQRGRFTAYDAVCPHQGCPVQFVSPSYGFVCPCHGSHFDPTGRRLSGPASTGLSPIAVAADGAEIIRRP